MNSEFFVRKYIYPYKKGSTQYGFLKSSNHFHLRLSTPRGYITTVKISTYLVLETNRIEKKKLLQNILRAFQNIFDIDPHTDVYYTRTKGLNTSKDQTPSIVSTPFPAQSVTNLWDL